MGNAIELACSQDDIDPFYIEFDEISGSECYDGDGLVALSVLDQIRTITPDYDHVEVFGYSLYWIRNHRKGLLIKKGDEKLNFVSEIYLKQINLGFFLIYLKQGLKINQTQLKAKDELTSQLHGLCTREQGCDQATRSIEEIPQLGLGVGGDDSTGSAS